MLSIELECIFVHIPKTAGQSIERAFLQYFGLTWEERDTLLLRANQDPKKGPPRLAHLTATEYVTCGHVSQIEFDRMRKFAFVRNPWARLVSEYRFQIEGSGTRFHDWVLHGLPRKSNTDAYRHIAPQVDYVTDKNGDWAVDFVGRYEALDVDYARLCSWLDIGLPELSWTNKSHRRSISEIRKLHGIREALRLMGVRYLCCPVGNASVDWRQYYDKETLRFVSDYYARDIELFGYSEPR